ncbi:ABC transporter substrate-binding protein [Paraburkholderia fungorum]|uniref:ABC transporter substrate-binding protein n=1 Tax=Paraburkholderia fungorum TaxID=134537 RepID=A0AAP5QH72_9BURK|nr:ABC transporter substrate-binding protein [Paraburkholderia fungorum]MDT8843625.1 ABC transporter substrate-binding protein [Paraburkholderia fungorum]
MQEDREHTNLASRRNFIAGMGALGASALFGGIAPAALAKSTAPLKIGSLNTYSKIYAALGNSNLNGMNLYFEQIGNTIAGRKIEIIREDDELNPQVGLQKLKKLVESDSCDIITGIQGSNIAMAAVQYMRESQAFVLCSGAGITNLSYTGLPYLFRCSTSSYTTLSTMGEWLYGNRAKEVVVSASDFAGGRNAVIEFKSGFVRRGGKISKEIYPPLGNSDFSPYLADIRNTNAKASFSFYAGSDAVRFVKQYGEYGLSKSCLLTGSGFMLDGDTLPAQGRMAIGAINALHYADTLDNAANRKFVADYQARFKELPNVYAEYGYVAARTMHMAIEAVGGDTSDKNKLRAAMRAVRFDAPRGPFRFTPETQSPTHNVYIREVAEIDGRITNKVIYTVPEVPEPAKLPI